MFVKPLKFSFFFLMPQGLVAIIYFTYNVFAVFGSQQDFQELFTLRFLDNEQTPAILAYKSLSSQHLGQETKRNEGRDRNGPHGTGQDKGFGL